MLWLVIILPRFISGAAPSSIITNVNGPTSVFLVWTPPSPSNQLQSYNLSYGVADLPERVSQTVINTFATLDNLEEFTTYEFIVKGMFFNDVEGLPLADTATTQDASKWKGENFAIL